MPGLRSKSVLKFFVSSCTHYLLKSSLISTRALFLLILLITCGCDDQIAFDLLDQQEMSLGQTYPSRIRVGSWNLKRLGDGTKRYDLAAQVIENNFDMLSIQEVMNSGGVQSLLSYLPGWSYVISANPVGVASYQEYYATLIRDSALSVTRHWVVPDASDAWAREPMVTCVKNPKTSFCVLSIHVIYGDSVGPRDAEITALSSLVNNLRAADTEKDYIVVGDFNRSGSASSFSNFSSFGFSIQGSPTLPTTLGASSYSNPYDHIILDSSQSIQFRTPMEKVDVVAEVCGGSFSFCTTNVSDHAPVKIVVDLGVPDKTLLP